MVKLETIKTQKIGRLRKGERREVEAKQVVPGSIATSTEKDFLADVKKLSNGNLVIAAKMLEVGANAYFKQIAAMGDEATKAAKFLVEAGLAGNLSVEELAERLREGKHLG